ncbi:hypothetical protein H0H87_008043 [Tephrocybe sp. NHM501043]|nr:hypothetical protein H0H87_008043 [Tephrocybe sp. NHM501043]
MPIQNLKSKLNDGNEIPIIGFGSGSVYKFQDVSSLVAQAIQAGFSHIDTAEAYRNEDSVGRGLTESGLSRDKLFVATKYRNGPIQQQVRRSLDKLGLQYLDLYMVHRPDLIQHDYEGCWREFEKITEDGLAKLNELNFGLEELQKIVEIARIKPAFNQIELQPYTYTEYKNVIEYSAKHGIVIGAHSSLSYVSFPGGPVDAPIQAAAKRHGITTNQVIFLWVRAKGAVIVTTSSKKERLEEYLAVGDLPPLTEEEIAAIDAAGAKGAMKPTAGWPKTENGGIQM